MYIMKAVKLPIASTVIDEAGTEPQHSDGGEVITVHSAGNATRKICLTRIAWT